MDDGKNLILLRTAIFLLKDFKTFSVFLPRKIHPIVNQLYTRMRSSVTEILARKIQIF